MTDAGRRSIEVAKANGWWTLADSVEDLIEPDELAVALDASPAAREAWNGFPPSARKQMLWWVVSAAKPETRAKRIDTIVAEAAKDVAPKADDQADPARPGPTGRPQTPIEGLAFASSQ